MANNGNVTLKIGQFMSNSSRLKRQFTANINCK